MQNNFEKQVRQKMEELSFNPAPPIWQNIESQIRIKKERRRGIIWFLFFMLMIGAGAWFWYNNENGVPENHAASSYSSTINENKKTSRQNVTVRENVEIKPIKELTEKKQTITTANRDVNKIVKKLHESRIGALQFPPRLNEKNKRNVKQQVKRTESRDENVTINKVAILRNETKNNNDVVNVQNDQPLPTKIYQVNYESINERVLNTHYNFIPPADTQEASLSEMPLHNKLFSDSGSVNKIIRRAIVYKWTKSLVFNGGISGSMSPLRLYPNAQYLAASNPTQVSGGTAYSSRPVTDNGISFVAGIALQKRLSKKISFNTGLLYQFASTINYVGNKVSQNITVGNMLKVDQYFNTPASLANITPLAGTQTAYRNSYHFISIPLTIEYRILKKLPLALNAGLSVKQLLHTNALIYDDNIGIFYNDKAAFRHTQLSVGAGIDYIIHLKRLQLQAGPFFEYGLTKTAKTGDNHHMFLFGMGTKISIAGKR